MVKEIKMGMVISHIVVVTNLLGGETIKRNITTRSGMLMNRIMRHNLARIMMTLAGDVDPKVIGLKFFMNP